MSLTRRTLVAAAPLAAAAPAWAQLAGFTDKDAEEVLNRYIGFGIKATGGPGDKASGAWMEGELKKAGFKTHRQSFDAPFADMTNAHLFLGGQGATVIPQAIVQLTGPQGLEARLAMFDAADPGKVKDAIALVVLPMRRWSTVVGSDAKTLTDRAFAAGAAAVVLITTGPTGEAIALNTPDAAPLWDKAVAILAPNDADAYLSAARAGASGRLVLDGRTGRRPAFNVVGHLNRGAARTLVISTPRSGWFDCAGERGPGIAAWVLLARWAARHATNVNLTMVAASAHEYENAGAERFIISEAPEPAKTALWVHLGANVAARDWQDGRPLVPLQTADPMRILMVTDDLMAPCRQAFAGQPGLDAPRPVSGGGAAGEMIGILGAGYPSVMGVFGSHRFHHTIPDEARCVVPALARQAAEGFRDVIAGQLASI